MASPLKLRARVAQDEILTAAAFMLFSKVAKKTGYIIAQKGMLPAFMLAGRWRLKRADLNLWIEPNKGASRDDREHE